MKKYLLLSILFFTFLSVSAQISFVEVSNTPFVDFSNGAISFADIDADGDQDVLLGGSDTTQDDIAHLYVNNGTGTYTEKPNTSFPSMKYGASAFADVDNDGDPDFLMNGGNSMSMYLNDGLGNFTEVQGTPFENVQDVSEGTIDFADVDNDNDPDVLVSGVSYDFGDFETNMYLNDGTGNFTQASDTFEGVHLSSSDFADIDGDSDLDLVISGRNNSQEPSTKLYSNDGSGNFTELAASTIDDVLSGASNFADVDNDSDYDLFLMGSHTINLDSTISELYLNNGSGVFMEVGISIVNCGAGTSAFVDVDQDNDMDIFIAGYCEGEFEAILYKNDGAGGFSVVAGTPFVGVSDCNLSFGDIDGDSDPDLILAGFEDGTNNSEEGISRTYLNTTNLSTKNFTGLNFTIFPNPTQGKLNLSNPNGIEIEKITVFDLRGKRIKTIIPDKVKNQYLLNLENLRSETYFLKIISKQGTLKKQLIKN